MEGEGPLSLGKRFPGEGTMNGNRRSRLPIALVLLLIYQGILVLASLGPLAAWLEWGPGPFLALAAFGIAMLFASVGMARRSPRGLLLGMIVHLLVAIPALLIVLCSMFFGIEMLIQEGGFGGWSNLAFILALMWLPFLLISGWAFLYLRRLRKSLWSQ
jgi:hypothetical protein